jgi:hypothetical protein
MRRFGLKPEHRSRQIAAKFAADTTALPSDFVAPSLADRCAADVMKTLKAAGIHRFGVRVNHAGDYPKRLRDARHPIELLYYQGAWELTETRCIAIVGSRNASGDGIKRAQQLAEKLTERNFTIVSGLAVGIDTAAHTAAIEARGRTIAVIGTPLGTYYPPQNRALQDKIAREYLVISQVPVLRYHKQAVPQNRLFFPEQQCDNERAHGCDHNRGGGGDIWDAHSGACGVASRPQASHSRVVFSAQGHHLASIVRAAWCNSRSRHRRYLESS